MSSLARPPCLSSLSLTCHGVLCARIDNICSATSALTVILTIATSRHYVAVVSTSCARDIRQLPRSTQTQRIRSSIRRERVCGLRLPNGFFTASRPQPALGRKVLALRETQTTPGRLN